VTFAASSWAGAPSQLPLAAPPLDHRSATASWPACVWSRHPRPEIASQPKSAGPRCVMQQ
jgi:hypothetical protein